MPLIQYAMKNIGMLTCGFLGINIHMTEECHDEGPSEACNPRHLRTHTHLPIMHHSPSHHRGVKVRRDVVNVGR